MFYYLGCSLITVVHLSWLCTYLVCSVTSVVHLPWFFTCLGCLLLEVEVTLFLSWFLKHPSIKANKCLLPDMVFTLDRLFTARATHRSCLSPIERLLPPFSTRCHILDTCWYNRKAFVQKALLIHFFIQVLDIFSKRRDQVFFRLYGEEYRYHDTEPQHCRHIEAKLLIWINKCSCTPSVYMAMYIQTYLPNHRYLVRKCDDNGLLTKSIICKIKDRNPIRSYHVVVLKEPSRASTDLPKRIRRGSQHSLDYIYLFV